MIFHTDSIFESFCDNKHCSAHGAMKFGWQERRRRGKGAQVTKARAPLWQEEGKVLGTHGLPHLASGEVYVQEPCLAAGDG